MSDLIVRDHSQPCEHGFTFSHNPWGNAVTRLDIGSNCPGGRVIVLRRSRGYSEMVEWEGEVWLEVEK